MDLCYSYDGLPRVGCEAADVVAWVHDGFGLRCTLHEQALLDIQREARGRRVLCCSQTQLLRRLNKKHWQVKTQHSEYMDP